jgi:hypothetical protein
MPCVRTRVPTSRSSKSTRAMRTPHVQVAVLEPGATLEITPAE